MSGYKRFSTGALGGTVGCTWNFSAEEFFLKAPLGAQKNPVGESIFWWEPAPDVLAHPDMDDKGVTTLQLVQRLERLPWTHLRDLITDISLSEDPGLWFFSYLRIL
jgi:hypothetical protein